MTDWADETRIRGGLLALGKCLRRRIRRDMTEARARDSKTASPEVQASCAAVVLESQAALSFLAELEPLLPIAAIHISRVACERCKSCLTQAQDCGKRLESKCCPDCTHDFGWRTTAGAAE